MKKVAVYSIVGLLLITFSYFAFVYYVPYSTGLRSGELIKISHKGVFVKTWEGEISQGISGAQIFPFSVTEKDVIDKLQQYQGSYVKLTYIERYRTFFWMGDTKFFVTDVEKDASPHQ